VRELDAVVDTVVRGVGPDDGPISLMQGSSIVHDTTPGIDGPGGHQREHPPQLPTATIHSDACSREPATSGETDSSMMRSATAGADTPSSLQQHAQAGITCESTRRQDVYRLVSFGQQRRRCTFDLAITGSASWETQVTARAAKRSSSWDLESGKITRGRDFTMEIKLSSSRGG